MATHSSILTLEIPWTEEAGGLQSRGLQESNTVTNPPRFGVSFVMKVKVTPSCPTLCDPHGLYSPWNSPGQNSGVP